MNKTRKTVSKECCERFIDEHKPNIVKNVKFQYESDKEVYPVCEKIPIIATKNLKDKNIYNAMEFKITQIKQINNEYFFTVNSEELKENEFAESFVLSF